ncbi:hypothetical protein RND81_02G165800 [Saponaria officinalis]|uniref:Uncharacterized protein n=1 Tax=Saponaria officinalis TaxID=3572 RepID=A0AAW1MYH9_SAPOF
MKVKLKPFFYRNTKPSSNSSVNYVVCQDIKPLSRQSVSYTVPDQSHGSVNHFDDYFGAVADETVNMKATNYISSVKARFRHEFHRSD